MIRKYLAAAVASTALLAQTPVPTAIAGKQIEVVTGTMATPTIFPAPLMAGDLMAEASAVTGAPYSAEFVTETVQTLADGNTIKNASTTFFARDSEGRTRRELTINPTGPLGLVPGNVALQQDGASAPGKSIFIHDPVAGVDYILETRNKTVQKIVFSPIPDGANTTATFHLERKMEGGATENVVFARRAGVAGSITTAAGSGVIASAPAMMIAHDGVGPISPAVKSEPLGKRMIEGLEAEGTRTTITIPAGQIGNERAVETVSERWYSPELKTVVLTTRSDPRTGLSTYKITNVQRGEPGRSLFEPPPDYTVLTEENMGPRMRVMRKAVKEE